MNKYILIILAGTVLLATSCKKKRSEPETTQLPETTKPGTTNPLNSRYSPAFTGQTRVNAALSGMHIVRLVIENNRVTGEERLLVDERQRFRDITQGPDNALYMP
jgi:glucose/arabinose dehydrogenase